MRVLFCYPHATGWRVVVKTPAPGSLHGAEVMITDEDWEHYKARYKPGTFAATGMASTVLSRAVVQIKMQDDLFFVSHIFPNGCISAETQKSPEVPHPRDQQVTIVKL